LTDWLLFEEEVAERLRSAGIPAYRTPLSGAVIKGDVRAPGLLIECKYNRNRDVAYVSRLKLERTIRTAQQEGKLPVVAFKLKDDKQIYVTLRLEDFARLMRDHYILDEMRALVRDAVKAWMQRCKPGYIDGSPLETSVLFLVCLRRLYPRDSIPPPPFFCQLPEQDGFN